MELLRFLCKNLTLEKSLGSEDVGLPLKQVGDLGIEILREFPASVRAAK
jgi:hypothetical protein